MALGLTRFYYCKNVAHCRYAREDYAYSSKTFRQSEGRCLGCAADGCGEPLVAGIPAGMHRRRLAGAVLAGAALLGGGHLARQRWFPPPLPDITFAQPESRVSAIGTQLQITLTRSGDLATPALVAIDAIDLTAKAGVDYEAVASAVAFAAGESRQSIAVTILPDPTYAKGDRHFAVRLANVVGQPRHVVFIEERKVDTAEQQQVAWLIREASNRAFAIARDVVKVDVLNKLLAGARSDAKEFAELQNSLQIVQGNLTRSREQYRQFIESSVHWQPRVLQQTLKAVREDLLRRKYLQQAEATAVLQRQLLEYRQQHRIDMDRWVRELGAIIPDPGKKAAT